MSLLFNLTCVITCPEVRALWCNWPGSAPHALLVLIKLFTLDLVSLLFCTSKQNGRVTVDKGFSSQMSSGARWWMGPGVDRSEFQSIHASKGAVTAPSQPIVGTLHLGLMWPDFPWESRKPVVYMKLMHLNCWQQIQNFMNTACAKQNTPVNQIASRDLKFVMSWGDHQLASHRKWMSWALCCWQGLWAPCQHYLCVLSSHSSRCAI